MYSNENKPLIDSPKVVSVTYIIIIASIKLGVPTPIYDNIVKK